MPIRPDTCCPKCEDTLGNPFLGYTPKCINPQCECHTAHQSSCGACVANDKKKIGAVKMTECDCSHQSSQPKGNEAMRMYKMLDGEPSKGESWEVQFDALFPPISLSSSGREDKIKAFISKLLFEREEELKSDDFFLASVNLAKAAGALPERSRILEKLELGGDFVDLEGDLRPQALSKLRSLLTHQ